MPDEPSFRELDDVLRGEIRSRLLAKAALEKVWGDVQLALYGELSPLIDARTAAARRAVRGSDRAGTTRSPRPRPTKPMRRCRRRSRPPSRRSKRPRAHTRWPTRPWSRRGRRSTRRPRSAAASGDRAGVVVRVVLDEAKPAADLRELGEFGTWWEHNNAARVNHVAQLSTTATETASHVFVYRVAELDEAPRKAFEDVAELARERYLTTFADERAEAAQEKLEDALDRIGREVKAAEIEEIESGMVAKLDEQITAWREGLEKELAQARERLVSVGQNQRARTAVEAKIAEVEASLAAEDAKREEVSKSLELDTEAEVEEVIESAYAEILDRVAAEAELEILELGPERRQQVSRGGATNALDKDRRFFYFQSKLVGLDVGDTTGVQQNPLGRSVLLGVVEAVEPAATTDLPRRDFLEFARRTRDLRKAEAMRQSFSTEALEKLLGYAVPGDEEADSSSQSAEKPN